MSPRCWQLSINIGISHFHTPVCELRGCPLRHTCPSTRAPPTRTPVCQHGWQCVIPCNLTVFAGWCCCRHLRTMWQISWSDCNKTQAAWTPWTHRSWYWYYSNTASRTDVLKTFSDLLHDCLSEFLSEWDAATGLLLWRPPPEVGVISSG